MKEASTKMLPKTIKGSVQVQWKRCGRRGCRCSHGYLHGPYAALVWWEGSRQKKRYLRLENLPEVFRALENKWERNAVLREARQHEELLK